MWWAHTRDTASLLHTQGSHMWWAHTSDTASLLHTQGPHMGQAWAMAACCLLRTHIIVVRMGGPGICPAYKELQAWVVCTH